MHRKAALRQIADQRTRANRGWRKKGSSGEESKGRRRSRSGGGGRGGGQRQAEKH